MYTEILKELVPALYIVGSFLVGFFFERIILKRAERWTAEAGWRVADIIVGSLHGMIRLWFLLVGVRFSLQYLHLGPTALDLISKLILATAILSATIVVAKLVSNSVAVYMKEVLLTQTTIAKNIISLVILTLGVLIIIQKFRISITPILTAFGIGGLAVALALQNTLSNLFAGFYIATSKRIRPGDYVRLESGEEGYVLDISWRDTTIRMLPNNLVVVPNSKLASAIITNYYFPQKELAVLVQVGVSYDSDLEKVERVTIEVGKEVMRNVEGGVSEFEPFIRYHTFSDFSINFTVILRAKEFVDQYLIKHEFIKRLHKRYKEEGIVIPFPIRTIYMKGMEDEEKR